MSDSTALASPADNVPGVEVFTFGAPAPVLDGLAKATRASVYLDSGLKVKRNLRARTFLPHPLLSRAAFEQLALDYSAAAMPTLSAASRIWARRSASSRRWPST